MIGKRKRVTSPPQPSSDSTVSASLSLWGDLPSWQKEGNDFIETGFRPESGSFSQCLRSWAYLHNESVNIYSHVVGTTLFLAMPLIMFLTGDPARYTVATAADAVVCCVYFIGVAICFILSAAFHTITNHSDRFLKRGRQLDYLGIVVLMSGAAVPLIYYGFYCDPKLQIVYWVIGSVFALTCFISTFHHRFSDPVLRWVRSATFAGLGLSTIVPVIHGIELYGLSVQAKRAGLVWVLVTAICDAAGAIIYAIKFPERWFRRRFDMFGSSHQVFHILIVVAGLAYTVGVIEAFDFLHDNPTACSR